MIKLFKKIQDTYPKCRVQDDKNYVSFSVGGAFVYELRIQQDVIRLLASNYPAKAGFVECFKIIKQYKIEGKPINGNKIIYEAGLRSADKFTLRIEIPYNKSNLTNDDFINSIINSCEKFHNVLMPLVSNFSKGNIGSLSELMGETKVEKNTKISSSSKSIQAQIADAVCKKYKDAVVKKVDKDNYLDIHLPSVNEKKGTHLFFSTSKEKIKMGFYCRDEAFIDKVLASSNLIETYSHGVRPLGNPEFTDVSLAVQQAEQFVKSLISESSQSALEDNINSLSSVYQYLDNMQSDEEESEDLDSEDVESDDVESEDVESDDEDADDEDADEDDEKGFPLISYRTPSEELKDVVKAYFKKWQKPSFLYAWRMGITAYIPEFVEQLVSDEICPVFTEEQIKLIYDKINDEKVIPILGYAPPELFMHTKHVWWIVPFCIWKEDVASMVFVDKNGFYALFETDGEVEISMIFPWDKLYQLDIEYAADDDPNICRLTLSQENGGYLTFDEFISEEDGNGSYLHVIEAIWEARRETIEASRDLSSWKEGTGGEGFKLFNTPSELLDEKQWLDNPNRPDPRFFA